MDTSVATSIVLEDTMVRAGSIARLKVITGITTDHLASHCATLVPIDRTGTEIADV